MFISRPGTNLRNVETIVNWFRQIELGHCPCSRKWLEIFQMRNGIRAWHLVPCTPVENPSCARLLHAAPLLEEERNIHRQALRTDLPDPRLFYEACARAGFATDNDPMNAGKRQFGQ